MGTQSEVVLAAAVAHGTPAAAKPAAVAGMCTRLRRSGQYAVCSTLTLMWVSRPGEGLSW